LDELEWDEKTFYHDVRYTIPLTAGAKDIYIVQVDESGNVSEPLLIAMPEYVQLPAPIVTEVTRWSENQANITFTSEVAG